MIELTQEMLAKRLKTERKSRGITQESLAQILNVPRTAIVQMENAKRNVSTLEISKLAQLYGCAVDQLLTPLKMEARK